MDLEQMVKDVLRKTSPGAPLEPEPPEVRLVESASRIKGDPVRVFEAQSANALSDVAVDMRHHNAVHVDVIVTGTSPSATLTLEGATEEGGFYQTVPDLEGTKAGLTANTSFDALVSSAWLKVRIASIAGTYGSALGWTVIVTPYVAAGTAAKNPFTVYTATGAVALSSSTTMKKAFRLKQVTCHFSAAPTTQENFTVTLNGTAGAAYDMLLLKTTPADTQATDIVYTPDGDGIICVAGDEIDVAFTNTDTRTYGLRIVCEEL